MGGLGGAPGLPTASTHRSSTGAGIAAGDIQITDAAAQQQRTGQSPEQTLQTLDRTTEDNAGLLKDRFDAEKLKANQEAGRLFGEEAFRAVGEVSNHYNNQHDRAQGRVDQAQQQLNTARAGGDASQIQTAQGQLEQAQTTLSGTTGAFAEGGTGKIVLHAVVGAAQAAIGGSANLGQALSGAVGAGVAEYARGAGRVNADGPERTPPPDEASLTPEQRAQRQTEARQDQQNTSALIGAAAGALTGLITGGATSAALVGASTGSATALDGEKFNRQLHPSENERLRQLAVDYQKKHPNLTQQEAYERLLGAALVLVDGSYGAAQAGRFDNEALTFISQNSQGSFNDGSGNAAHPYFRAIGSEYSDSSAYQGAIASQGTAAQSQYYQAIGSEFARQSADYLRANPPKPITADPKPNQSNNQEQNPLTGSRGYVTLNGHNIPVTGGCGTVECVLAQANLDTASPQYAHWSAHQDSDALNVIPVVSTGFNLANAVVGFNLATGEPVDRGVSVALGLLGLVGDAGIVMSMASAPARTGAMAGSAPPANLYGGTPVSVIRAGDPVPQGIVIANERGLAPVSGATEASAGRGAGSPQAANAPPRTPEALPNPAVDPRTGLVDLYYRAPEAQGQVIQSYEVGPEGLRVYQAVDASYQIDLSTGQVNKPGAFFTPTPITNLGQVRDELAVKPEFKVDITHVGTSMLAAGTRVQESVIGPQIDAAGRIYPGGGIQIEVMTPRSERNNVVIPLAPAEPLSQKLTPLEPVKGLEQ